MPMLMGPPNRACYKHTCRIQQCLNENNYDARACAWAIDALKRCCEMPHAAYSIHCAFPDLNRQKQQQQEGDQKEEKSGPEEDKKEPSSNEMESGTSTSTRNGKESEERIEENTEKDSPG